MTKQRALRLAREWAQGHSCSLRNGEAEEYHAMFAAMLEESMPNEPLTFEERREMDGKPVWLDDEKTWGILQVWDDNNVDVVFLSPRGCVCVKSVIGKKIYRRPPEGEEDT